MIGRPGQVENRQIISLLKISANGVGFGANERGHNPLGVETWLGRFPRVAGRLATLGWRTQSLWDWRAWHSGLLGNDKPQRRGRIVATRFVNGISPDLRASAGCCSLSLMERARVRGNAPTKTSVGTDEAEMCSDVNEVRIRSFLLGHLPLTCLPNGLAAKSGCRAVPLH